MWTLKKIHAQNVCAFKELTYELQKGVTTLVFGDNRDNESQRSNGSGKSALIECIAIGITGTPLRKIKNEEIINDEADECLIELEFTNDSNSESFVIERKLFRKGSSKVDCYIYRDGIFYENEGIQPSVEAYNKYFLEMLGITKEELFNNFILSKFKYQEFLSCSDKEKKDIINRFSNGSKVDTAIEKLVEDIIPVDEAFRAKELEFAGNEGRIDVLSEQIEAEENSRNEREKSKVEKINAVRDTISAKETGIDTKKKDITFLKRANADIFDIDTAIQQLENSEESIESCYQSIKIKLDGKLEHKLTDWNSLIQSKKNKISVLDTKVHEWNKTIENLQQKSGGAESANNKLEQEYAVFLQEHEQCVNEYHRDYQTVQVKMQSANDQLNDQNKNKRQLSSEIETLKNKLAGTITCPECSHKFILTEEDFSVESARKEVEEKENTLSVLSNDIIKTGLEIDTLEQAQTELFFKKKALISAKNGWDEKVSNASHAVKITANELQNAKLEQKRLINEVVSLQEELAGMRRKLFDEVYQIIDDNNKANEREIKRLQEDIKSAEGSIAGLKESISELENSTVDNHILKLKDSLKSYKEKSIQILDEKKSIESELFKLKEQEQHFIHFKTYLANSKIEALAKITNEFLENIGSDIRINFSGYTYLKSGKIREKISVSLIRSGVDCGSFGKFSAGESARVNLATILAMQKLINTHCDDDKGLDLLVLDEILEAVDESGLAHTFEALNKLKITALVVSHGNIAESYPHKIQIVKENGESRIEL